MKSDKNIEMTENYEMFSKIPGNRAVDELHVQRLMDAMSKEDLFTPILVNTNMAVVDGQHRLEARKRLQLIVPYLVVGDYGLGQVQALNSRQKAWSISDYTDSYIQLGIKDYAIYRWFIDTYKLPHIVSVSLLASSEIDGHGLSEMFKSGGLKVIGLGRAKEVASTLCEMYEHFPSAKERNFIVAFLKCLAKAEFKLSRFQDKLAAHPFLFKKQATMTQYLSMIEEIYNYKSRDKVSLRYS